MYTNTEAKIKSLEDTIPPSERNSHLYQKVLENTKNPYHCHTLATPLFEVLGISIHCANPSMYDNLTVFEIYGLVRVTDEEGTTIYVYNQDKDCPELITLGGSLSLSGEHCGAVSLSTSFKVELNLRDRARDVVIAKGLLSMNCMSKDDFEQVRVEYAYGEQSCFAVVRCIAFQHAVTAYVDVLCKASECQSDRVANIHGSIITSYGHNYKYLVRDNITAEKGKGKSKVGFYEKEATYTSCILFDKSVNQSVQVKFGTNIPLNRNVVVVPAYTSVVVRVDLMVCDSHGQHKLACEWLEFDAKDDGGGSEVVKGTNGFIEVRVTGSSAHVQLAHLTKLQKRTGLDAEKQDILQFLSYLQSPLASKFKPTSELLGSPLVEVFSISVHPDKGDVHNLCGTILVDDGNGKLYLMNTNDTSSEKGLHIVWPSRSFAATEFELLLDIKIDDESITYGYITWNYYLIEAPISWYHRRLCSIIRGRYGYTTVHYIFIKDALQGMLKISLCGRSSSDVCSNVWVRVSAYYDDDKYSTWYERDYYQILLFSWSKENSSHVTGGSEIQLAISVIAVPTEAYLIVEAELWVSSSHDEAPELVSGVVRVKGEAEGW